MSFLGFGAPLILIALVILPVIWFLLRTTPPKPSHEPFPPLGILRQIVQEEQTAQKTPWWLVLLRLILSGLIILALAQPLVNPRPLLVSDQASLVLMIDNGFAAQMNWQDRVNTAKRLLDAAQMQDLPIYIIATAEPANTPIGPYLGAEAREVIDALSVRTILPHRALAVERLAEISSSTAPYQIAYLGDGLAGQEDAALTQLATHTNEAILWYQPSIEGLVGLKALSNESEAMRLQGVRSHSQRAERHNVIALDGRGRRLGETEMIFAAGEGQAQSELNLPLEMRNDIVSLSIEDGATAAATYLTSATDKRRRIALLGVPAGEMVQPLLTPLYYPMRALAPFGDLILTNKSASGEAIEQLLDANPSLLVVEDDLTIPRSARQKIMRWLEAGGTLLRFAGPRLAASVVHDDELLPVRLRRGERTMGGAMSWKTLQKIASIPRQSPFFGLDVPEDVTVSRQILAEPEPQLFDKSWLNLEDGTPLVTAEMRGRGRIILIHTTAAPDWSNLALSGFFVEMLQRLVTSSHAPNLATETARDSASSPSNDTPQGVTRHLPPWRILSAEGTLIPPPGFVRPLEVSSFIGQKSPDFAHPPGLYGSTEGEQVALNLLEESSQFEALAIPATLKLLPQRYEENHNLPLEGLLWAMALILFTIDCLIMLKLRGGSSKKTLFSLWWRSKKQIPASALMMAIVIMSCLYRPEFGQAQENDAAMLAERAAKTHLAYVITGNAELDNLSRAGLEALGQFIAARTTIEPGEAIGVDLALDDLSFYPLLYWPVDARTDLPNDEAIVRLGAYMRQGGSVLFDTRDQLESGLDLNGAATANTAHLRLILESLDIPPLEPAPVDHVVARSFYIMPDFPGRYRGSDLWLEALPSTSNAADSASGLAPTPIVRAGDGVSPILITANDFIGAWAQNDHDDWFYPTIPDEPSQRLWAFRAGLNIVMYLLSGNYKADQVHAPELLQRLGN